MTAPIVQPYTVLMSVRRAVVELLVRLWRAVCKSFCRGVKVGALAWTAGRWIVGGTPRTPRCSSWPEAAM